MDIIAVIPVRSGSKRLPKKNYKSFNSRTLAEIARDKCLDSGISFATFRWSSFLPLSLFLI